MGQRIPPELCIRCGNPRGDSTHHSYCRDCFRAYSRARYWRLRPREPRTCVVCGANITTLKRQARACPGACRTKYQNGKRTAAQIRAYGLLRHYGISVEEYDSLLLVQNDGCAICGKDGLTSPGGVLAVDHNHDTGRVRGLLCADCNRALGQFQEDPALLRRAAAYLEESDAAAALLARADS